MIQNQLNNLPPKLAVCNSGGRSVYFSNYWPIKIQVQFDHKCDVMENQSISGQEPNKKSKHFGLSETTFPLPHFLLQDKTLWMVWDPPFKKKSEQISVFSAKEILDRARPTPLWQFSQNKNICCCLIALLLALKPNSFPEKYTHLFKKVETPAWSDYSMLIGSAGQNH